MSEIIMKVISSNNQVLSVSHPCGDGVSVVHNSLYKEGDYITIEIDEKGFYYIQLDEALPESLVYINETLVFPIPIDTEKICYSPKAFSGEMHLLSARPSSEQEKIARRNLACNPYDRHKTTGFYPHAIANVETRNEAVFAARNAIDGIHENSSHGAYPYSSWGINQNPLAELKVEFGRTVLIDSIRLTLRADFPHDNWWQKATITFSDGSNLKMDLVKTALPQEFNFEAKEVEFLTLGNLIKSEEESPFPALTQIEAYGQEI